MEEGVRIQRAGIRNPFVAEIGIAFLNSLFGQSGPFVQSGKGMQFGADKGTPHFGSFVGNIGGSIVQDIALNRSRYSHGEGKFGSALSDGDCLLASWFGPSHTNHLKAHQHSPIGM